MSKYDEVSPPGWSGTTKAMKKHKDISNPFALAWYMKNKGDKAHYKPEPGNTSKSPKKPEKKEKYKHEKKHKCFGEWLQERHPEFLFESITQDVISAVEKFLSDHAHYDDEFDVSPLLTQLGLQPVELQRIIGLLNQRLPKQDPIGSPSYDFNPHTMTARYSSQDI
jgi:hypothetical protein